MWPNVVFHHYSDQRIYLMQFLIEMRNTAFECCLGETRDSNVQHSCSGYKNIVCNVVTFMESSHRQDCFWIELIDDLTHPRHYRPGPSCAKSASPRRTTNKKVLPFKCEHFIGFSYLDDCLGHFNVGFFSGHQVSLVTALPLKYFAKLTNNIA